MFDVSICVIGAGYWGKNHIRTLNELGSLGGIVESNEDIQNTFKKLYPNVPIFSSLDKALHENDFSGFTIATPAETHFSLAKKVIEAKKHVLVEKPLTLKVDEAVKLIELSNEANINLMVGHLLLFHPAIVKIKSLIESGKIGKLQYIYSNRLNLGQVRTKENVFWSLAPHDISIFQYLTNSYPNYIHSNGSIYLQDGIHDSTLTQLKYPNGIEGHIFVSWLHPFKEHRLVIIGSEAMITFDDSMEGKPLKLYDKKFVFDKNILNKIDGPVKIIEYEQKMALTEELKYFIRHLTGEKLNIANGEHALEVMRILISANESLHKL